MKKTEIAVHKSHCCVLHGCKYGDKNCPVENRQILQDFPCEFCREDANPIMENFWQFNNGTCWLIKRYTMVDMWLYLPTMKYIYKTATKNGEWRGTKNPNPAITMTDNERSKIKKFNSETEALKWMTKKGK